MSNLELTVVSLYNVERDTSATKAWSEININIRTAVLAKLEDSPELIQNSLLWDKVVTNEFTEVSAKLKESYALNEDTKELHEAYQIDAVTIKCNKATAAKQNGQQPDDKDRHLHPAASIAWRIPSIRPSR